MWLAGDLIASSLTYILIKEFSIPLHVIGQQVSLGANQQDIISRALAQLASCQCCDVLTKTMSASAPEEGCFCPPSTPATPASGLVR